MAADPSDRSWYSDTAHPRCPAPPLIGDHQAEVCVVGAGYTGLSAALTLAERGIDVVLVEADTVGAGGSGRNGGQIVTGFSPSTDEIEGMVGADQAQRLWQLGEEAKRLVADRVARHQIDCDLRWGYLFAAAKPRQLAWAQEWAETWPRDYGYHQARLVDHAEVATLAASPRYLGGLFDAGGGQLHPLNFALGLAAAARAAGARLFEASPVTGVALPDRSCDPVLVDTARGRVRARWLILAVNAGLGALVPQLADRVLTAGTFMAATEPLAPARLDAVLRRDLAVCDLNFVLNYYRRSSDDRLLFGGGVAYGGSVRRDTARLLRAEMVKYFPTLADVRFSHCWGGEVAITANRLPHVGRLGERVLFAHGFSGHGVALATLVGALAAEAVAGTVERFDVFARVPSIAFPGGRWLRRPLLLLAMTLARLRDALS